jgi:hypothetical protein
VFTAKKMNNSQQLEGMSYHCCHTRGSIVGWGGYRTSQKRLSIQVW